MKTTILDRIADNKRIEIAKLKSRYTLSDLEARPLFNTPTKSLKKALENTDFGIIAEFKRKSPGAGIIREDANPEKTAKGYEMAGASAISCLTDASYFGGSTDHLAAIRQVTNLPLLRKDFILDEFQLFEAKALGADAVLLISELLDTEYARQLTIIAQSLGMEVLMEAHDSEHLAKINEFVDVIGINNRNLHLQKTDLQTSIDLHKFLPKDRICISESGVKNSDDLKLLSETGYHGALVGEALMKSESPESIILKNALPCL